MFVYRTIQKKAFWEFDSIIMQNVTDILLLFCTPTWSSYHVSVNQEYTEFTMAAMLDFLSSYMQISHTLLMGKTTEVRGIITRILTTPLILF